MATFFKKELKPYAKKYIDELLNYMKEVHEINNFLTLPKEDMYNLIYTAIKKDGDNYSLSWKANKIYSLMSYYEVNDIKTKYTYFKAKYKKINKEIEEQEDKQEQTKKEADNYLNIYELRNIAEKYKDYKHIDEMYIYLLFSCLSQDQEVLRPQIYANIPIIREQKDIKKDAGNYLYISKTGKSGYFYINNDKVSEKKTHEDKHRIRLSENFLNIILRTLKDYPREKLFNFDVENPENKLLYLLQKTTEKYTNKKFNFQMGRSAFITHKYLENPNMSYKQKKTLAENMRNSKPTQEHNYFKHFMTQTDKSLNELIKDSNDKLKELKNKEKNLNDIITELNAKNINKMNYKTQNFNININNEEKSKILLNIQEINAINTKYDEMINESKKILDEYKKDNEKKENLLKNAEKYLLTGNYDDDIFKIISLTKFLNTYGLSDEANTINNAIEIFEDYDASKINKFIKNILENIYDVNADKKRKEQNKFNKNRRDIIRIANARIKESIKNKDDKIKGQISHEKMYKYKIEYDANKKQYY